MWSEVDAITEQKYSEKGSAAMFIPVLGIRGELRKASPQKFSTTLPQVVVLRHRFQHKKNLHSLSRAIRPLLWWLDD
jgi:hypothetical protein